MVSKQHNIDILNNLGTALAQQNNLSEAYDNYTRALYFDPNTRGTLSAARSSDPNSANSQFFICFNDCSFLDGQYSVWGQVIEGMEFVDNITRGEPPAEPDKIIKMEIVN